MKRKEALVAAAMAGLMGAALAAGAAEQPAKAKKDGGVKCYGVNKCAGKGKCGGEGHGCAGKNGCKGKGWLSMPKESCEAIEGGTIVEPKAAKKAEEPAK